MYANSMFYYDSLECLSIRRNRCIHQYASIYKYVSILFDEMRVNKWNTIHMVQNDYTEETQESILDIFL